MTRRSAYPKIPKTLPLGVGDRVLYFWFCANPPHWGFENKEEKRQAGKAKIFTPQRGELRTKRKEQKPLSGPAHCQRASLKQRRFGRELGLQIAVLEGFSAVTHLGSRDRALQVARRDEIGPRARGGVALGLCRRMKDPIDPLESAVVSE